MIKVEIQDKGILEFPDDTTQEVIDGVVRKHTSDPTYEGLFPTVKKAWDIWGKESKEGYESMKEAYEEPSSKTIGKGLIGALQWGVSPLTGFAKGIVRTPVETSFATQPEPVKQFMGELAENATYFTPYGKLVKATMGMQEAEGLSKGISSIRGITKDARRGSENLPPLEFPKQPTAETLTKLKAEGELHKPFIQEGIQKEVADQSIPILEKTFTDKKRVGQQVVDLIHSGDIKWEGITDVLGKYKITPEELATQFKDTYSTAGRTLQRLSAVKKELQGKFPEMEGFFDKFLGDVEYTGWDKFMSKAYNLERNRRGLLVTQLATTMRNIGSQGARVTLGAVDDSLQGAIESTIGGKGNTLEGIGRGLDTFTAFVHRLSPEKRKILGNIIDSNGNELERMRLFSAPVAETVGGKVVNALNTLNRTQEYFFRKIAFESKLTQELKKIGMDIKNIDPSNIPQETYRKSVDYALEMTFAAMPKSKAGKKFVTEWAGNPLMTALFNPFPRFAFGNALPFIKNFSPIGFLEALNPKVVAELASGNPEKFAKLASEATLGTLMLNTAVAYRNSPNRGDKYWEVKVGNKSIDTRAYAPMVTPYLFIGEILSHPEKITAADFGQNLIGLNRIAGTGLILTDVIRSKKLEDATDVFTRLAGEYAGSFTVPFKTIKDLYSEVDPKEAIIRERRENPLIAPAVSNIPILSQQLPEAVSPLKTKPMKSEEPAIRQLTGLSIKTKTPIESEIDSLGLDKSRIYPKTGIPEADRELSKYMAPLIEKISPQIIGSPNYKKLPETMKRVAIAQLFMDARKEARQQLLKNNPELSLKIKYEGLQDDIKSILRDMGYRSPK